MTILGFVRLRSQMCKQFFFARTVEAQDILWVPSLTSKANIYTATKVLPAIANHSNRVFANYSIYKGKGCLSIEPVLPTFVKLQTGRGIKVDRRGCVMLTFMPAIGPRKYDWEKKQYFSLSETEIGSFLSMSLNDSCEFFHDPSMKSSNAGQVYKSLSAKPIEVGGAGLFFSLRVVNNIQKTNEQFTVPVTIAEFAVMRSAFSFALPYILGWGAAVSSHSVMNNGNGGEGWSRGIRSHSLACSEWEK